jgi:AAA+ superfamily predicted ATPase
MKEQLKSKSGANPLPNTDSPSTGTEISKEVNSVKADVQHFTDLLWSYLQNENGFQPEKDLPKLADGAYRHFIEEHGLTEIERTLLAATLTFNWKNGDLLRRIQAGDDMDVIQERFRKLDQVGILLHPGRNKFALTAQAVARLLANDDQGCEEELLFALHNSMLFREGVIIAHSNHAHALFFEKELRMDPAYFDHLLWGTPFRIDQTEDFKARLIETKLSFDDLMLNENCKADLQILVNYIRNYNKFHASPHVRQLKKGFVAMFHGYPGTGKTLTAKVIGKETGLPTYRVDISQIISKYIGETEKNLEAIFRKLENKDCILFFDEADALFGKRSEVYEAKDRYANQEVSYLLQRIEDLDFIVILATNFVQNMDPAFQRRINFYINMDLPEPETRKRLWEYYFPKDEYTLSPKDLIEEAAQKYAITGANIHNVVKHACNEALANGDFVVTNQILRYFLSKEYFKEGRNFNQPDTFHLGKAKGFR